MAKMKPKMTKMRPKMAKMRPQDGQQVTTRRPKVAKMSLLKAMPKTDHPKTADVTVSA